MSKKQKEDKSVGVLPFNESTKLYDLIAAASLLGLELHVMLTPKREGSSLKNVTSTFIQVPPKEADPPKKVSMAKAPATTPAPKTKPPKEAPKCPGRSCMYFHRPSPCECIRDGADGAPDKYRKKR